MHRLAEINSELRICKRRLHQLRTDLDYKPSVDETVRDANLWMREYSEFEKNMFGHGVDLRVFRTLYLPVYQRFDEQFKGRGGRIISSLESYMGANAECADLCLRMKQISTLYAENYGYARQFYGDGRIGDLVKFINPVLEAFRDVPLNFKCFPSIKTHFIEKYHEARIESYIKSCDVWVEQYDRLGYKDRWTNILQKINRIWEMVESDDVPFELESEWEEYRRFIDTREMEKQRDMIEHWRSMDHDAKRAYVTKRPTQNFWRTEEGSLTGGTTAQACESSSDEDLLLGETPSSDDTVKKAKLWMIRYNEFERNMFSSAIDIRIFRTLYLPAYQQFRERFMKSGERIIMFLIHYIDINDECADLNSQMEPICNLYTENYGYAERLYRADRIKALVHFINPICEAFREIRISSKLLPTMNKRFIDSMYDAQIELYIKTRDLWVEQYDKLGFNDHWIKVTQKIEKLKETVSEGGVPPELTYEWKEYSIFLLEIYDLENYESEMRNWRAMNYEEKCKHVRLRR